jgi:hypothetical protein
MTKLSPADIGQQIAALDATIHDLQARAADLALGAVEADPAAVNDLQAVRAEIALIQDDRRVLRQAESAALGRAAAEAEAKRDAERAAHLAEARTHAAALLASACRIDNLVAAFHAEIALLTSAQTAVRAAWRAAGEPLNDARVGRANAQAHACFLMQVVLNGSRAGRNDRSMSDLISTGWVELLNEEAPENV